MAWKTPKTNWTSSDYFNASDYNRIIGNISYLKDASADLFKAYNISSMGAEKTYLSLIYAREMNTIEQNLETINSSTYGLNIGNTQTYQANRNTPLWSEFNRIESSCLLLYRTINAHREALPKLAFTLGGQKGLRV